MQQGRGGDLRIAMTEPLHDAEHRGLMLTQAEAPLVVAVRGKQWQLQQCCKCILAHFVSCDNKKMGSYILALIEREAGKSLVR